jgi:hypothetical protein
MEMEMEKKKTGKIKNMVSCHLCIFNKFKQCYDKSFNMTCRLYHHQQKKGMRGAGVDLQKWEEHGRTKTRD